MAYTIQLENVRQDKSLMTVTRLLASEMLRNPYLTVSDFFRNLNEDDLEELMYVSEHDEDDRYGNLILLTEMLTSAEGIIIDEEDEDLYMENMTSRMRMFMSFLALESLSRKGLIRLFRENMSFGDEYMDKKIAEAIKQ